MDAGKWCSLWALTADRPVCAGPSAVRRRRSLNPPVSRTPSSILNGGAVQYAAGVA
jgi:hypothetical protein